MYLLDTNILSEVARRHPNRQVVARFETAAELDLFTSAVCIEEIFFGLAVACDGELIRQRMDSKALHRVTVIALDAEIARIAGALRGEWKNRGTPVGYRDGLIAATAKARSFTLVTRNTQHFDHVVGLRLENWFEETPTAST